ncbi:MAG: phosphoribosylglycinamide formyltransferase [Dehalococcoidia bacterium]
MTETRAAPLRIGWFASGMGSGSRALLSAAQAAIDRGELRAEIPFLFCNREPGEHENSDLLLAMAERYSIPTVTLSDRRYRRRVGGEVARAGQPLPAWRLDYDRAVMDLIAPYGTDVGMLAGYMLIFGREACDRYNFLNLHPAAPGGPIGTWQRVIWQLIDQRAGESGVLINRVIPEVDAGPVLAYCCYPLRGPDIDPLWHAIGDRTVEDLQRTEGEDLPLFRAIREHGVRFEIPLMVQSLIALADGRIRLVDGEPFADGTPLPGGLDLSDDVARMVDERTTT